MPDGKSHTLITYALILPVFVSTYTFVGLSESIIVTVSFLFAGLMFNGDLDIHSDVYKRWMFLRFIWIPYRKMFNHRSFLTHGFMIGTIIRLLYISVVFFPLTLFIDFSSIDLYVIMIIFIGLEIGSMSHSIADLVF